MEEEVIEEVIEEEVIEEVIEEEVIEEIRENSDVPEVIQVVQTLSYEQYENFIESIQASGAFISVLLALIVGLLVVIISSHFFSKS